jgi:PAS domain S-box-containing protein
MSEDPSENLDRALDCVTDGIVVLDPDWRFTYLNRSAERFFGRPRQELVGRVATDLLSEEIGVDVERLLRHAAGGWEPLECDALTPVSRRWLTVRLFPSDTASVLYLRDVTERKAAEDALLCEQKRAEDRLRTIADAGALLGASLQTEDTLGALTQLVVPRMADACIVDLLDASGLRRVAAAHRDPFGAEFNLDLGSPGALQDREVGVYRVARTGEAELVPVVDDAWLRAAMREDAYLKVVRSGMPPTSMVIVPFRGRAGVLGVLTLCLLSRGRGYEALDLAGAQAIADRAALAIENARLFEQTVQAKRMREDVLGIVSHDLRGPLNAIALNAHALARKTDASEVRAIERAVPRAEALISDLLTAAVLEAGSLPLDKHPENVRAVVEDAVDMQRPNASHRSVQLETAIADDIPPVAMDRHRVLEVLGNLLDNALRVTPAGGRVRVNVCAREGGVAVDVSDTGPGMAPEQQAHVFDRFWQGSKTRRAGAGLGLAIAKGIVEAHHGSLRVESTPGRGATFSFVLPLEA